MPRVLRFASICICALFAVGCARHGIQVFNTANDQLELRDDQWVHENDTVAVLYGFYGSGGHMSFAILNKSPRPLYINWKTSALVLNGQRMQYWTDATRVSGSASTRTVSSTFSVTDSDWAWIARSVTSIRSESHFEGVMARDEMVTSLPPQSYIGFIRYRLASDIIASSGRGVIEKEESNPKRPLRKEKVKMMAFSKQDSPVRFRNFLQLSFSEEMSDAFYVDDEFWVNVVLDMSYRHFQGEFKPAYPGGRKYYAMPFKKRSSFYLRYVGGDQGFRPKLLDED